ncbi:MAG: phosphoglycerate dehydrogenase [Gammaproteobacteria bacterium]|nr:phosphoglycerate dehydrogenase [Gammaproteobacteria bacterium]MDE2023623.1 phosphoglycerate dehydrogenase [Gammaproteobacteria bacterium]
MSTDIQFILDFDSTLIRVEMMDVMAEVAIPDPAARADVRQRIQELTDAAMAGRLDYRESLQQRLALLHFPRSRMPEVIARLQTLVTPSFLRNHAFLAAHADRVHVLTGGFRQMVEPVIRDLGLRADRLHANTLSFDAADVSDGCDWDNPLSREGGKIEVVQKLKLDGRVIVVGDGWSDYKIHAAGAAARFYAFTENIARPEVIAKADHVAPNFDEVLYDLGLRAAVSYPKNRLKVLLLENIHADAVAAFQKEGYSVETVAGSLEEDTLGERLADVSVLGIRSKTQLTERALAGAKRLLAVGAFCIGTNQMDLHACERKGVVAFNAPFSNTRSVVELALAEIIFLLRGIPEKIRLMDHGVWDKSAKGAHEVRGKRLGIVGYGNIGMQLSVVAESLGMDVCFYDVAEKLALGNAHKCATLDELLETSDAVTVHVDGRKENTRLIGVREFARMRPGAVFLNLARGHVVDLEALRVQLETGRLRGAALDVYPEEPHANGNRFEHPLRKLPNALLTPHIGGSTLEAQRDIGRYVSSRIIDYVNTGNTEGSVNFPPLRLPPQAEAHRLIHVHENVPGILAQINQALVAHGANILGQYLKTHERLGYVITDINRDYSETLLDDIRRIPHTLRFRVLY